MPKDPPEINDNIERCCCPDCCRQMPWRAQLAEERDAKNKVKGKKRQKSKAPKVSR